MINQKKIAIAIMARDCAESLNRNIPKLMGLSQQFKLTDICVVENDSKDYTKEILKKWSSECKNVHVISLDNVFSDLQNKGAGKSRIERMTYYRNQYLNFFYESGVDYDYLFVIDIDIDDFDVDSIIPAIDNAPEDWQGLFSNGVFYSQVLGKIIKGRYYDSFAYLPYQSENEDLIDEEFRLYNDTLTKLLKKNSYQVCDSAFGGIGIYKFSEIYNRYYQAEPNHRSSQHDIKCEHISFNRISKDCKKHNYIVSSMNVLYERKPLIEVILRKVISEKQIIRINKIFHRR